MGKHAFRIVQNPFGTIIALKLSLIDGGKTWLGPVSVPV